MMTMPRTVTRITDPTALAVPHLLLPLSFLSTTTARKPLSSPIPQIDVTYNVPDPVAKPSFQLLVNLQEPGG